MAFFRCGGSGIPASLKSGMNSVLNKKFGTSTTYDPAGWPADVNLLGPLPVKTASGAIASFVDGADGVPVKSCTVSFLPSGGGGTPSAPVAIVGHSGITLTNKDNMSTPTHTDTYTDTFGQTLYGGTRDLTTDKASVTYGSNTLNELSESITYATAAGYSYFNIPKSAVGAGSNLFIMSCYPVGSSSQDKSCWKTGSALRFRDDDYTSVTALLNALGNERIAYDLATPTEITGLTPHEIDTLYGDNNIYSDTGTTEVEYRADIDLALNA